MWNGTTRYLIPLKAEEYGFNVGAYLGLSTRADHSIFLGTKDRHSPFHPDHRIQSPAGMSKPPTWKRAELLFGRHLTGAGINYEKVSDFAHIDFTYTHPLSGDRMHIEFKFDYNGKANYRKRIQKVLTSKEQYQVLQSVKDEAIRSGDPEPKYLIAYIMAGTLKFILCDCTIED